MRPGRYFICLLTLGVGVFGTTQPDPRYAYFAIAITVLNVLDALIEALSDLKK